MQVIEQSEPKVKIVQEYREINIKRKTLSYHTSKVICVHTHEHKESEREIKIIQKKFEIIL